MRMKSLAILMLGTAVSAQSAMAAGLADQDYPSNDPGEVVFVQWVDAGPDRIAFNSGIIERADHIFKVQIGVTSRLRHMVLQGLLHSQDFAPASTKIRARFAEGRYRIMNLSNSQSFDAVVKDILSSDLGFDRHTAKVLALAVYEHFQDEYLTGQFIEEALGEDSKSPR